MTQPTHFIEQYKYKEKEITSSIQDIKNLERNLKITAASGTMQTIAVWRIKLKPGVKMPQPE